MLPVVVVIRNILLLLDYDNFNFLVGNLLSEYGKGLSALVQDCYQVLTPD